MVSVLKQKYPEGVMTTWYKRTLVEEYAPYVQYDGMVVKITRFKDFDCTIPTRVEDLYENRQDKLRKIVFDYNTQYITEYFGPGREDAVIGKSCETNYQSSPSTPFLLSKLRTYCKSIHPDNVFNTFHDP